MWPTVCVGCNLAISDYDAMEDPLTEEVLCEACWENRMEQYRQEGLLDD